MLRGWRLALLGAAHRTGEAVGSSASALWTFPSVLIAALIIAWGAEAAQFFMSQGLALAILAWLQTLPEFAVEANIAWRQDVPDMTANFTGSLRLLVGLGWPMIFVVASYVHKRRTGDWLREIKLAPEHSVEVMGLLLPVLYFLVIWWKATLTVWDGAVLLALYIAYLYVLSRVPPPAQEGVEELDRVPRALMSLPPGLRGAGITGMFVAGGLILYYVTHPFVDSLKSLALGAGISEFVFIQWVAPFLSEFPEKVSAFKWASTVRQAPMALMNLVSSNINQWTVLAAMIPVAYSLSAGEIRVVPFDGMHRMEILLTILQSMLGLLLLLNMRYSAGEALTLFVLWLIQFVVPSLRGAITCVYGALIIGALVQLPARRRNLAALPAFARQWKAPAARRPVSRNN